MLHVTPTQPYTDLVLVAIQALDPVDRRSILCSGGGIDSPSHGRDEPLHPGPGRDQGDMVIAQPFTTCLQENETVFSTEGHMFPLLHVQGATAGAALEVPVTVSGED